MSNPYLPGKRFSILTVCSVLALCAACASGQEAKKPGKAKPAKTENPKKVFNGITIDRKKRTVDIEARVCLRDESWLELLACTKSTKEHESILSITARPSEVHGALLLIGLTEGSPQSFRKVDGKIVTIPPKGPRVTVSLIYKNDKGKTVEVPAHHWMKNQKTGKPMKDSTWLFTGSYFEKYKVPEKRGSKKLVARERYAADLSGTILSLVNFGDEVLSRDTTLTDKKAQVWIMQVKKVPPRRTKVTIRLRATAKPKAANVKDKKPNPAGSKKKKKPSQSKDDSAKDSSSRSSK